MAKATTTTATNAAPVTANTAATVPSTPAASWQLPPVAHPAGTVPKAGAKAGTVPYVLHQALAAGPCTMAQLAAALATLPTKKAHQVLPALRWLAANRGYTFVCQGGLVTMGGK